MKLWLLFGLIATGFLAVSIETVSPPSAWYIDWSQHQIGPPSQADEFWVWGLQLDNIPLAWLGIFGLGFIMFYWQVRPHFDKAGAGDTERA